MIVVQLSWIVQQSWWAREPVHLFQWCSSQVGLGDLTNCLVSHWVAALHAYLKLHGPMKYLLIKMKILIYN